MAYNKYKKLAQLNKDFGVSNLMDKWLPLQLPTPKTISPLLIAALAEASDEALASEKAKSESIVVPIIKELKRSNPNSFSFFSGYQFEVDADLGLNGFCDYILSANIKQFEVTAPILCLVEAKDGEIEKGFAQCGAEMYAAKLFNEKENANKDIIFGCVTNAFSWCFLKLENNTLYIDPNYVPLTFDEPHKVLAVLQWILDESLSR